MNSTQDRSHSEKFSNSGETQRLLGESPDLGKTSSGAQNSNDIKYVIDKSMPQLNNNDALAISDNSKEDPNHLDMTVIDGENTEGGCSNLGSRTNQEHKASSKKKKAKLNFRNLTRHDKITIMLLTAAHFSHMVGFSLMAPFFSKEAQKKGISQTVTGLIFSCFEFCIFLSSPIFGSYISTLGATFMFCAGITVAGVSTILFGLLHYCGPTDFVVMCFITRSFEALGISAYVVASLAIASSKFPDNMAMIFGLMEMALSVGLMIGPLFGSFLYELGGYGLPFYVLGSLILSMGVVVFFFFPAQETTYLKRELSTWRMFQSGLVWVTAITVSIAAFGLGFLDPTLALHAQAAGVPEVYVGLLFVLLAVCYAGTAPLWGYLSDKKGLRAPLIICGNLVCIVSYLIIGPSPILTFLPHSPWPIVVGMMLFGFAVGCTIVPTMTCLLLGAQSLGFADDLATFGMISGLFTAFFCMGSLMGPFLAGVLVDRFGFEFASTVVSLLFLFAVLISTLYFGCLYLQKKCIHDYARLPLRVTSDEDSIPIGYNTEGGLETSQAYSLSVLSLSMRAGVARP